MVNVESSNSGRRHLVKIFIC